MDKKQTAPERREFLTRALTLVGGCMCSGLVVGCESDVLKSTNVSVQLNVADEPALTQVGGSIKKVFDGQNNGRPVLIIRRAENAFLVLSSVCTHEACEVDLPGQLLPDILCQCHGSLFSRETGEVLRGPATARLPRFESAYNRSSQTLTISF